MNLLQKVKTFSFHKSGNGEDPQSEFSFFVLDLIPTPAAYITVNHRYGYINKAYADWFEVKKEDVIGKHVKDFLGSKAYQSIRPYMEKAFSGVTTHYEREINFKQGLRFIEATYTPHFDPSGKVIGYVGHINDVTEKRLFEKELLRKQNELQDYVDNASMGLHWVDENGIIIWANKAELDMLGYSTEEYIGHHISEFHADQKIIDDILSRLKNRESVVQYEAVLRSKDGTFRTVIINSNVLSENGKFIHTRCFTTDITERKKAEIDLHQSEFRFRSLIEGLPAAVYTTDSEGYVNLYNEAAVNLWGRKPRIGLDRWCGSIKIYDTDEITEIDLDDCPMAIAVKEGRQVFGKELIVEREDKSRRYIMPYPQPLFDTEGKVIGGVNVVADITDQKLALKALKQSEKRYHNLIQGLPAAIYTTDQDGIITMFNEAAVKWWGHRPEIGKDMWCGSFKIFELDGITEVPLDECPMAIALKEKRKVTVNEPFIVERPDGVRRYFMPHPEPIYDLEGNMTGAINMLVDMTESRIAEEHKARLAAIIQSSGDAIISKSLDSIVTSWNPAAEKTFGFSAEEMIGQSILKIFPKDKLNEESFILDQIRKGKKIEHYETKRIKKDGTLIDVSVTISAIKDSKGNIVGASKVARNITERKEAQRLLREKEEHLRMAIESAHLGTWEYDPNTFSLICSEESRKICGIPEDLKPDFQMIAGHIHDEDKDLFYEKIKSAIDPSMDGKFDMQLRIHRYNDDEIRWIKTQGIVFFNANKEPERLIGTMLDITDEKNRVQELMKSELLFKTISNAAPVGLWMADTTGQCTFVNETWVQWTGIPIEKQIGSGWLEKVMEEDKREAPAKFLEAVKKKEKYTAGFRIIRNDGQLRWCLTEGYPYFSLNGELVGYAGSVTDITDMKTMEQRKDDFIKMASHELKTPITSINGYVQLLLNIYNEQNKVDDEKSKTIVKTSLKTISKQVVKLTRLISELLDLSKIESGRLELDKSEFNLEELIEETVQDARQTTSRHAIIFRSDYEGKIKADRDRIAQVMTNLLNNAIKYSPDADKVEIFLNGNDKFATIQIVDHGIGINKKDQQKIFDRFYRVEGKDEQTFPGFGIGLFITSEIIQRHQGSVTVKSEKNKGSVFTVTLPLHTNGIETK